MFKACVNRKHHGSSIGLMNTKKDREVHFTVSRKLSVLLRYAYEVSCRAGSEEVFF